jgi:hypothetical protein
MTSRNGHCRTESFSVTPEQSRDQKVIREHTHWMFKAVHRSHFFLRQSLGPRVNCPRAQSCLYLIKGAYLCCSSINYYLGWRLRPSDHWANQTCCLSRDQICWMRERIISPDQFWFPFSLCEDGIAHFSCWIWSAKFCDSILLISLNESLLSYDST